MAWAVVRRRVETVPRRMLWWARTTWYQVGTTFPIKQKHQCRAVKNKALTWQLMEARTAGVRSNRPVKRENQFRLRYRTIGYHHAS